MHTSSLGFVCVVTRLLNKGEIIKLDKHKNVCYTLYSASYDLASYRYHPVTTFIINAKTTVPNVNGVIRFYSMYINYFKSIGRLFHHEILVTDAWNGDGRCKR